MCSCDLPGGSGALAMGPMRDLHLHRETAPGKVEQWWSGVLGTRAAGTSCSWVVAGALFRLGSHQSPTLSAGPFGGYPWLFSFPLIYDPFVLKPYSQAPSPLPSPLPRADTKIFLFPLEKSWEVCLWLQQRAHTSVRCSWDSWKLRNWSFLELGARWCFPLCAGLSQLGGFFL